jgi:hypothetical protein
MSWSLRETRFGQLLSHLETTGNRYEQVPSETSIGDVPSRMSGHLVVVRTSLVVVEAAKGGLYDQDLTKLNLSVLVPEILV